MFWETICVILLFVVVILGIAVSRIQRQLNVLADMASSVLGESEYV